MTRAAIYSRYSSDRQNPKSIEHQEAEARAYAAREGLDVVAVYSDSELSGASLHGRDGIGRLMDDARARLFDVVVVEEIDRLSRGLADSAGIFDRLTYLDIEIRTLHEGTADIIKVGMRGLYGQMALKDLAIKTRRGLKGKINEGLIAASAPYGYCMDPLQKGRPIPVPEEVAVLDRIFREYDAGTSPRQIAIGLNADGIAGARGDTWSSSTIEGWAKRGTGILRNRLYNGEIVWNRTTFRKDPDTGRRTSRPNAPSEYVIKAAEEFRIIDAALFARVQARLAGSAMPARPATRTAPRRLLSGLLVCGACGGGMSLSGADKSGRPRLVCTRHRETKACPDPHTFYADVVEATVIEALRRELGAPELLVEYVRAYNAARIEFARDATRRRSTLERRIHELDGECDRLLRLLTKGIGNEDRITDEIRAREAELKAAQAELALEAAPVDIAVLHPSAIRRYEAQLLALQSELEAETTKAAPGCGAALREIVDSVTVYATPAPVDAKGQAHAKQGVEVKIVGKLRRFLDMPATSEKVSGIVGCGGRIWANPLTFEPLYELRACA